MTDAAGRMMVLFRGLDGVHGTHGVPNLDGLKWVIKQTARTLREPVTVELWERHLQGRTPLGVVPILEDGNCVWGSIDIDVYDQDHLAVIERCERQKFPLVPCRSKSGGLHLFCFTEEPMPAAVMQSVLRNIAASLGVAGSEVFPKQTTLLLERGDAGNWMVMPYFGGTFGGKLKEQVLLKRTGAVGGIEEFLHVAERRRLTVAEMEDLAKDRPTAEQTTTTRRSPSGELFSDGPRCLEIMSRDGFPEGGRNSVLFMIGIYLKRRHGEDWEHPLREANTRLMVPPLQDEEVDMTIVSLRKRDYEYTCKTEPMCSHCDAIMCRGRRFGVGVAGSYPVISGITKLDIPEDPLWFVDIEEHRLELNTEELQSFQLFQRKCLSHANRMYRQVKPADWAVIVANAMINLTVIEAPLDAGVDAQFREMLEDFLVGRARGKRREDLFQGMPWTEDGNHYFRLQDLMRFLAREGMRDAGRGGVARRIQRLGGAKHFFNLKGKGCQCWALPEDAVGAQVPEPDAVPVMESPI